MRPGDQAPGLRDGRSAGDEAAGESLARDAYRGISLYAPDRAPCAVDLSDNTNLWGVPPSAAAALRDASAAVITRYPSLYAGELKRALADYAGVAPDAVVTGCGSDDVLDSAFRAFAEPGDRVVFPDPSFMMIPLFARMNGLEPVAVPLTGGLDIDAAAMIEARGRITYICSPNNPTGTPASVDAMRRLVGETRGLIIIDAAYIEFTGQPLAADVVASDRVLVVRTLSKAFGLAGLRIGYATGHPRLVAEVEKSRGPYKVNAMAERAAIAALRDDMPWVKARIAEAQENRDRLAAELTALGVFAVVPSYANFVLAALRPGSGLRAADIATRLRERGVAIRPFTELRGLGDAIRISVGPWAMMEQCLAALGEIVEARSTP